MCNRYEAPDINKDRFRNDYESAKMNQLLTFLRHQILIYTAETHNNSSSTQMMGESDKVGPKH